MRSLPELAAASAALNAAENLKPGEQPTVTPKLSITLQERDSLIADNFGRRRASGRRMAAVNHHVKNFAQGRVRLAGRVLEVTNAVDTQGVGITHSAGEHTSPA